MQCWERVIDTLSVQIPKLHEINPMKERREIEYSRRQKGSEQPGSIKKHWANSLKASQFHTIEHRVTKIVPLIRGKSKICDTASFCIEEEH